MYCRIEQKQTDLSIRCLQGGLLKTGNGTVDGKHVHLAWGNMMLRIVIDATAANDDSLAGTFAVKLSGIRYDDATPSVSERLASLAATPDAAGKSKVLAGALNQLAAGALTMPHDEDAIKQHGGVIDNPGNIRALGAIQSMQYVGQTKLLWGSDLLKEGVSIYVVEFDSGERICGLHQRDDGVLDGFMCI